MTSGVPGGGRPPLLVVSPHLDDAVLSCGALLQARPGSVVVTLFAGAATTWSPATEWDRTCGFHDGDDVTSARRAEDASALARLKADPVWLDLPEVQYREHLDQPAAVAALESALADRQPLDLLLPVGLHHEDHMLAHDIGMLAARAVGWSMVKLYADYYHLHHPDVLQDRLANLEAHGPPAPWRPPAGSRWTKFQAARSYTSQLRGLGRGIPQWVSRQPEQFWTMPVARSGEPGQEALKAVPCPTDGS